MFLFLALILGIILLEKQELKKASKADKITFFTLLCLSAFLSFFKMENLPGPFKLLNYIFGFFLNTDDFAYLSIHSA